jgi:prepilin peptidase CpaA
MSLVLIRAVLWSASLGILAAAAATDVKERIIPNRMVLFVAGVGVTLGLMSRPSLVWLSLLAAFGLLVALGLLARLNVLGGGDVKLIAAVSLLVPPDRIGSLLLAIAFAGGLLSLGYLAAYRALKHVRIRRRGVPAHGRAKPDRWPHREWARIAGGDSVPYGMAILGGVAAHVASELYRCFSATSCSL